ncbi:hypothetical protein G9A89_012275 [Geosiphon pyriformis]|nr:hypothetical protein G9A89_012275 [Geosiphon pyriformis]
MTKANQLQAGNKKKTKKIKKKEKKKRPLKPPLLITPTLYHNNLHIIDLSLYVSIVIRKKTPMEAAWQRAIQQLDSCPHDDNKIWQMALAKIEGATPEEIKTIKDNPPEPLELDWDAEPIINLLDPEQFHEHYQELAPTRKEQEQWLEQLNARLCQHCLIPCDFQYCNECDLIYNPPPCMI